MTRDDAHHDPCTPGAREEGCTCRMSSVNSATIDPPEPVIDKYCPLHGWAPDPDDERQRRREDEEFFRQWGDWPR
jgi:hypothetical protein